MIEEAGRELLVEPKLEIHMRIEGAIGFSQQPPLPIRVFFPQLRLTPIEPLFPLHVDVHLHLFSETGVFRFESPTLLVHVPFLLDVHDIADASRANEFSYRQREGLTAVLRSHLHNLFGSLDDITRLNGFREHVGKGLFDVTVLARFHYFRTKFGVLEVAGRNHHAVDIFEGEHLFGILEGLRLEVECLLYLGGAMLAGRVPKIAHRYHFHRRTFRSQRRHVDMSLTAIAAAKLTQSDAVVGSQDAPVGFGTQSGSESRVSSLLHKRAAIDSLI